MSALQFHKYIAKMNCMQYLMLNELQTFHPTGCGTPLKKHILIETLRVKPYRKNVIPRNLNSLLRPDVAVWTFDVWFHAKLFPLFSIRLQVSYQKVPPKLQIQNFYMQTTMKH